jgi:thiaminase/transcriptional activator TenA
VRSKSLFGSGLAGLGHYQFLRFVDFLRAELDRVGPAHADLCRDFFSRAVALELSFFEAAYTT